MNNRVVFRLAIIGVLVFDLAIGAAVYWFDDGSLDPARELLPDDFYWASFQESHFILSMVLGGLLVVTMIASIVGVLLFRNWGRWLYVGVTVLVFPISILTGASLYYGWESALWDVASMAYGAILLAMFLPPISNEFNSSTRQR